MPTQSTGKRTRTGCWTCRKRGKKCDETRPGCNNCAALFLQCTGYGIRLRWSEPQQPARVMTQKLTTSAQRAPKPQVEQTGAIDTIGEPDRTSLLYHLGQDAYRSLNDTERCIIYDFIRWGAATLLMDLGTASGKYFEIFAQSRALLTSCLAYQANLDSRHALLADQYTQQSITVFRRELSHPMSVDNEATVYVALLLCSISMNRAVPWTVHLNGIAAILEQQKLYTYPNRQVKDYTSFLGILDLPIHTLGRKTPLRNIWYDHCRFQQGIDVVTGLPYSLIDLLSAIEEPDVVAMLRDWTMENGSALQLKVWDVTRHAAIIVGMDLHRRHLLNGSQVRCVINLLQDLKIEITDQACQIRTTLLFPLVAVGTHPSSLTDDDKGYIIGCITDLADGLLDRYPYYKGAVRILQELWYCGEGRSAEQIARDLDLEQSLF